MHECELHVCMVNMGYMNVLSGKLSAWLATARRVCTLCMISGERDVALLKRMRCLRCLCDQLAHTVREVRAAEQETCMRGVAKYAQDIRRSS